MPSGGHGLVALAVLETAARYSRVFQQQQQAREGGGGREGDVRVPLASRGATSICLTPPGVPPQKKDHLSPPLSFPPLQLLPRVLDWFLGERGLGHPVPAVSCRACYLLQRVVKTLRQNLLPLLPQLLAALQPHLAR